jgi:DNA-binding ferritin-like protein
MFHWCTPKYSHHLALDKVYSRLQDHIDKFVEVYLARFNKQPVKTFNVKMTATSDCSDLVSYYETQIDNLKKIKTALKSSTELQGIVESMIADVVQHIYLLKLE